MIPSFTVPLIPSFAVPLEVMLASQPGSLPLQSAALGVPDGAALAPLLLGAMLWVVLLVAMRVVRDERDPAARGARAIPRPPRDGVPAAA